MGLLIEPLSGGLVTSRGLTSLEPGELSGGQGLVYRPASMALFPAAATSDVGTPDNTLDVLGLRVLQYTGGTTFLLAETTGKYWSNPYGTATFTQLGGAITGGATVESTPYAGRYYVFNGVDPNKVVYMNGATISIRNHGVVAQPKPPTVSLLANVGAWTTDALGAYEYWTTEMVDVTEGSSVFTIESDFTGTTTAAVIVTDTTQSVQINQPAVTNTSPAATRWRIYRAFRLPDVKTAFPAGQLIAELPIATTLFIDGSLSQTTSFVPTVSSGADAHWSNLNGILTGTHKDANAAHWVGPAGAYQGTVVLKTFKDLATHAVNMSTPTDSTICGIEFFVRVKAPAVVGTKDGLFVELSSDGGSTFGKGFGVPLSFTNAYPADTQCVLGGQRELFDRNLGEWDAHLNATDFAVRLTVFGFTFSADVDDFEVKFWYGGRSNLLDPYPAWEVTLDGATSDGSMLAVPPKSTTGDVFENSLVVNDVSSTGIIRYSAANDPEHFPSIYFCRIDLTKNESVIAIRSVGSKLVVLTPTAVWRINYLPRFSDTQFDRGRPLELISGDVGCANVRCTALFTHPENGRPMLAFFGAKGLYATDGFNVSQLSSDIDWITAAGSNLSGAMIINKEHLHTLYVLYPALGTGVDANTKLEFCYHPSHRKDNGSLKASTVVPLQAPVHSVAYYAPDRALLYGQDSASGGGGKVVVESTSNLGAIGTSLFAITRLMFPAGITQEVRLTAIWVVDDGVSNGNAHYRCGTDSYAGNRDLVTPASGSINIQLTAANGRPMIKFPVNVVGEGFVVTLTAIPASGSATDEIRLVRLMFEGEGFGGSDSKGGA